MVRLMMWSRGWIQSSGGWRGVMSERVGCDDGFMIFYFFGMFDGMLLSFSMIHTIEFCQFCNVK